MIEKEKFEIWLEKRNGLTGYKPIPSNSIQKLIDQLPRH